MAERKAQVLTTALRVGMAGKISAQRAYSKMHHLALRGLGYGVPGWQDSGEVALLKRLAKQHPDFTTIFDVGANVGGWSNAASGAWPKATIHAFEPARDTFATLEANSANMNVRCTRAAVSDTPGNVDLYEVDQLSGLSSLYLRDLSEVGVAVSKSESVRAITIDDYCNSERIARINLLKLDIEGHELAALHGAERMITAGAVDAIQFEFGGANIDSRTFLRDFVSLLGPRYTIHRVLADGTVPLRYSEREEIFVTANYFAVPPRFSI